MNEEIALFDVLGCYFVLSAATVFFVIFILSCESCRQSIVNSGEALYDARIHKAPASLDALSSRVRKHYTFARELLKAHDAAISQS